MTVCLLFRRIFSVTVLIIAQAVTSVPAGAHEPPIVPGLDPGGVAVAILGTGLDYTHPKVAARLARDGEGDLIAWDFSDGDGRPYSSGEEAIVNAIALLEASRRIRLVVIKGKPSDPAAIGHMAAFAARTPARIIFCPDAMLRTDWQVFKKAVSFFKDRLFVIMQHGQQQEGLLSIPNLLILEHNQGEYRLDRAAAAISRAAEFLMKKPETTAAALKSAAQT